jgi:hypothetical protein
MTEDATPAGPDVVLGFDAAWGFSPTDQTSPALAGAAGALVDVTMIDYDQQVTELRIHGVSGSDGPTMLEHPQALQVAGDTVTGFFRRWSPDGAARPSVPWRLEAYSWGGLTEAPLASASWLLLAPFMMYNVAYFMLPPEVGPGGGPAPMVTEPVPHLRDGAPRRAAGLLLRLLALAATVQFVSAAVSVVVSTVAWQAAGQPGMLPGWMGWYASWTAGWRVALALAAVALVVGALWLVSVRTEHKYEARTSTAEPEPSSLWPLTQPGFWRGRALVRRQRELHSAAACASAALIAGLPGTATARWVAVGFAAAVLATAAVLITLPMADRHEVTMVRGGHPQDEADWMYRGVLIAAAAALILTALIGGFTDTLSGPQPGALPGLPGFLAVLLAVQVALLIALTVVVVVLAGRARAAGRYETVPPYLRGGLAALVALLGLFLGGLLTSVLCFGVTRILGTPVPSGFAFDTAPPSSLAVPWPIYAFGAAPIGLLVGAVAAAVLLWRGYRGDRRGFQSPGPDGPSPVAAAYNASSDTADSRGDDDRYAQNRGAIAKTWAVALLTDRAADVVALAVGVGMLAVIVAEIYAAVYAGPPGDPGHLFGWLHGLASVIALAGILIAGWLVMLLRAAYTDTARRKTIGSIWDVATFWPRAVHPLAPPCYAERAIPEVVDRIRLLTGHVGRDRDDVARLHVAAGLPDLARTRGITVPAGPLLLTGYSQGSVIAPAVIAQLPPDVIGDVALLTLACPARRLYGRAFPAYFGGHQLDVLRDLLHAGPVPYGQGRSGGRWKNLRRRSDYIGSFVFTEPEPCLDPDYLRDHIDQPCWDPVILVPDTNPTPPPTHRHSTWWQDPRTAEVGSYLVRLLQVRHPEPGPADPEP